MNGSLGKIVKKPKQFFTRFCLVFARCPAKSEVLFFVFLFPLPWTWKTLGQGKERIHFRKESSIFFWDTISQKNLQLESDHFKIDERSLKWAFLPGKDVHIEYLWFKAILTNGSKALGTKLGEKQDEQHEEENSRMFELRVDKRGLQNQGAEPTISKPLLLPETRAFLLKERWKNLHQGIVTEIGPSSLC